MLRVLRSGVYVLGPEVTAFEAELAARCGVRHAVACASGTDALVLALLATGLRPGNEVVVPAFTIYIDAEVVSLLGGVPRFAEIDPLTFTLNPARLAEQVTPRTRAVIVTHLYGTPADMEGIRAVASKHGLAVIEDACQAVGSVYRGRPRAGWGTSAASASSPPRTWARAATAARSPPTIPSARPCSAACATTARGRSTCTRRSASTAASTRSRLPCCGSSCVTSRTWLSRRRELSALYDAGLSRLGPTGVTLPGRAADRESNHHQYTIRSPRRDALRAALAAEGIESAVHYPLACFQQPVYAGLYPEAAGRTPRRPRPRCSRCLSTPSSSRRASRA